MMILVKESSLYTYQGIAPKYIKDLLSLEQLSRPLRFSGCSRQVEGLYFSRRSFLESTLTLHTEFKSQMFGQVGDWMCVLVCAAD